ncbi:MAG: hypothetical protein WD696_09205 [Bryobacteraceae bacterium]
MGSSVVQGLKQQVFQGFHALPKRGAEVGGVLLGRIVPEEPLAVWIDDFEPVPCEYRFGPSFTLSTRDRARLEEILARRRSDPELTVVGYYRSCTGRELALDTADEELIRAYFPDPQHVFLSVKPLSSLECLAYFFFWRDGELPTKPAQAPFPFDATERRAKVSAAVPELAGRRTAAAPEPPEAAPAQNRPDAAPPPAPHQDEAQILEPVEPPAFRQAMRERRLRRDEVETAREQRLWPSMALLLTVAIGCAFVYQWWESGRQAHLSRLDVVAGPPPTQPASVPPEQAAPEKPPEAAEPAPTQPAPVPLEQAASANPPEAAGPPPTQPVPAPPEQLAPEKPPEAVEPAPQVLAETPEEPPPPRNDTVRPAIPAVIIHKVQPGIPEGIQARIRSPIVVAVEVRISASGKVTGAVAEGQGNGLYTYLAGRAAIAARWWEFQPAKSKQGKPVASTKIVYFVFK